PPSSSRFPYTTLFRSQLALDGLQRLLHGRRAKHVAAARDGDIDHMLRQLGHALLEFGERPPGLHHDLQDLQGGHDAVPGGGAVQADDVAGGLAAEAAAMLAQQLQHIAVTHLGAVEFHAQRAQRYLQAEIAHQGTDHGAAQGPLLLPLAGDDEEDLVAIDYLAILVDHDDPVAVAVEGHADVGALGPHALLQLL